MSFLNPMLVWNIFLAFLPVLFSEKLLYVANKKILLFLLFFLWLIFWPNTFYVITDIIHLSTLEFYKTVAGSNYGEYLKIYSTNITNWINLLTIAIGVAYSIFCGFISERYVEKTIFQIFNFKSKNISKISFRFILSLASGFAIYIGRFLRLNSWDIFNIPKYINKFNLVGHNISFVIYFILSFALVIFILLNSNYLFNRGEV
ncbi:DUF1361 domain-containing protein [Miniphocaeibacter massiliensis]|uniref:DUF1361 domain-containing protein n=1 Tax=Miniphocaeibacter massiliensis TaxID=2041841 RepID=UPI0013EA5A74|nr:DUF1361 domain-containing protein [Miniphocaeibacter massiliensis]